LDADAPLSVHLAKWPEYDASLIDEQLNQSMELVMKLASLGHAARNKANMKVRQPLAEAQFSVGNAEECEVVEAYADLLEDELNVKHVRPLEAAGQAVSYALNPLPKQLGQKYGRLFPELRKVLVSMEPDNAAREFLAGRSVSVELNGETYEILPEEVEVRASAREGLVVANDGAYLAALVTDLTPELVQEGLAREFVRRVQDLRKQVDLDIADRIRLYYQASSGLEKAIQAFTEYITNEPLTVELVSGAVPEGAQSTSADFGDEQVTIGLEKAE